jgi:hypothetical protein
VHAYLTGKLQGAIQGSSRVCSGDYGERRQTPSCSMTAFHYVTPRSLTAQLGFHLLFYFPQPCESLSSKILVLSFVVIVAMKSSLFVLFSDCASTTRPPREAERCRIQLPDFTACAEYHKTAGFTRSG